MPSELKNERNVAKTDVKCQMLYTNLIELYCLKILLFFPNLVQWIMLDDFSLQQREVKLSEKDSSCVINNCLPGTTHFVRLIAIDADGQILEKSKQLTVQTSAPPDSPILSVRYF